MSKKDDIMLATKQIISEEGVMQATIGHILKKAGTGYGTLYNYFESKEDLYLAVYLDILEKVGRYIFSQTKTCTNAEEGLKLVIRHYTTYSLNHIVDFNTLEAMRHLPEMCAKARSMGSEENGLYDIISMNEEEGVIKKRLPFYNMNFITGIVAIFVRFYADNAIEVTEAILDDFVESCMNAVR